MVMTISFSLCRKLMIEIMEPEKHTVHGVTTTLEARQLHTTQKLLII